MNAQLQAVTIDHADETTALEPIDAGAPASALTPMQMAYQLIARGSDPASIKDMLAVGREIERDQARRAFDAALSMAKAEIPPILKNRTVDFTSAKGRTHYRHEDLGEIARTVDPILARHGLSYRFRTEQDGGTVKVTCVVAHCDGHTEENALSAGRDDSGNKNGIQQIGSTITYLQRYTLKAALGLAASDDDDGRTAEPSTAGEPITTDQRDELLSLIAETETDIVLFCRYYKIDGVAGLPKNRFGAAKAQLLKKKGA